MMTTTRRFGAVATALTLLIALFGGLTGTASADVLLTPPTVDAGYGRNYGYELDWSEPSTGTTGVTSYVAEVFAQSDSTFSTPLQTKVVDPPANPALGSVVVFTGLTPGSLYVGTVRAVYGVDGTSIRAVGTVAKAFLPPGKVTSFRLTVANHRVRATWKAPAFDPRNDYGDFGFFYHVEVVNLSPAKYAEIVSTTSTTVTGLTNGRTYTVKVSVLSGGEGPTVSGLARPFGPPPRPSHLSTAWLTGGRTRLTWRAPASTAAAPISSYLIYVNGNRVETINGSHVSSCTVGGESRGRRYRFAVRTKNAVGGSAPLYSAKLVRPRN